MKSFAGFLNILVVRWLSECSWRSSPGISDSLIRMLEVALDHDYAHFLYGNAIKQPPLVYASVWHARDIALVAMRYMAKRLDGKIYFLF